MRPAGRDRARSGRAAALAALAIVGLMAASRSMQRAPGSAPAAKALQQRPSSREVAATWAGEGDRGPLLDIEVWARPVNAAAAAPSNPLRALLSEKEQRGLVQLCGRCLYHSLKHVTHPRDLGGMTFVATGEAGGRRWWWSVVVRGGGGMKWHQAGRVASLRLLRCAAGSPLLRSRPPIRAHLRAPLQVNTPPRAPSPPPPPPSPPPHPPPPTHPPRSPHTHTCAYRTKPVECPPARAGDLPLMWARDSAVQLGFGPTQLNPPPHTTTTATLMCRRPPTDVDARQRGAAGRAAAPHDAPAGHPGAGGGRHPHLGVLYPPGEYFLQAMSKRGGISGCCWRAASTPRLSISSRWAFHSYLYQRGEEYPG